LGHSLKLTGAGRTDKGVHALFQAASFETERTIAPARLQMALNAVLPGDISIARARRVGDVFNARYAAQCKIYQYRIWNRPFRSVWMQGCSWHVVKPLDVSAMRCAASFLLGRHDFSAFGAAHGCQKDKVVNMRRISISRRNGCVLIECEADRFLYKMVRNIVGILVEVGGGKRNPEEIAGILAGRDRRRAGRTAPAQGLFMKKVVFPS
jgi:tRNA pseudouridine38-40 synthase